MVLSNYFLPLYFQFFMISYCLQNLCFQSLKTFTSRGRMMKFVNHLINYPGFNYIQKNYFCLKIEFSKY